MNKLSITLNDAAIGGHIDGPGASPRFGRGGGQEFFFQICKFACHEATCCAWRSHALC